MRKFTVTLAASAIALSAGTALAADPDPRINDLSEPGKVPAAETTIQKSNSKGAERFSNAPARVNPEEPGRMAWNKAGPESAAQRLQSRSTSGLEGVEVTGINGSHVGYIAGQDEGQMVIAVDRELGIGVDMYYLGPKDITISRLENGATVITSVLTKEKLAGMKAYSEE